MTTLSEYKAMMEGATDAPWEVRPHSYDDWGVIKDANGHIIANVRNPSVSYDDLNSFRKNNTDPYQENSDFIAASRNIAPSLIRVIELAESAISRALSDGEAYIDKCNEALSEIRKLRGE